MSVHFLGAELSKWDEAKADALVLTVFSDERPLRGAAGLADWRLCGRLSRLVKRKHLVGEGQEVLMMPPGRRLTFPRIVLFGLGKSADFSEDRYRHQVRRIRKTLSKAGLANYALQPPGRATGLIAARRALEIWMEESEKDIVAKETVAIVDTPGAQKEMADILHAYHRRGSRTEPKRKSGKPGLGADAHNQQVVKVTRDDLDADITKVAGQSAAERELDEVDTKVAGQPAADLDEADTKVAGQPPSEHELDEDDTKVAASPPMSDEG